GPFEMDIAYYDGTTWTTIPTLTDAGLSGNHIVARAANEILVITSGGPLRFYNGTTWRDVPRPTMLTGNPTPGPWDESGAQLVFSYNSDRVCTALYTPEMLASGGPPDATCIDAPNS